MTGKKIANKPGDVFAVPLNQGGYAIGLIARKNKHTLLGYFFNKVFENLQDIKIDSDIDPNNVMLIARFSSLGIEGGEWPILATMKDFTKEYWPIPVFTMQDPLTDLFFAVTYEEDLLHEKARYKITGQDASKLYSDGLNGYGVVVSILSKFFAQFQN